jgi:hypothetical protein
MLQAAILEQLHVVMPSHHLAGYVARVHILVILVCTIAKTSLQMFSRAPPCMVACCVAESISRSLLPDGPGISCVLISINLCWAPCMAMPSMAAPADRIDSSDEHATRTPIW